MKLRSRKSEYQQCYGSPDKDYFKMVYEEQLTYRQRRRDKENRHMLIQWDSESSDGNSQNLTNEKNEPVDESMSPPEEAVTKRLSEEIEMSDVGTDGHPKVKNEKSNALDNCKSTENMDRSSAKRKCRSKSKTKSGERGTSRSKSRSRGESVEKPPFVAYGWADKTLETGRQKTHNIQAPKDMVYPAALKRLHYIALEKKRQKEKAESRPSTALSVVLSQKKQSDSAAWQSEYQRCYSSQSSRPSSAPSRKKKKASRPRSTCQWKT
ncbi:centriole, cilia and spindle-associated protein-like [Clavelina lepadiformis]|uniref:centriole, cilia and spindle-associated protein-like n=1 Tax=Clavelina lepadiformis TaxID=159417 RepID=UPI00404285E9